MAPEEDYIGMFDEESEELPPRPPSIQIVPPGTHSRPFEEEDPDDWSLDPVPIKLEKIRAAVLNAKSAAEVKGRVSLMDAVDWLDLVVKMSPKNVQVTGAVSFTHLLQDLGPIDKEKYRLQAPVEEAEFEVIK